MLIFIQVFTSRDKSLLLPCHEKPRKAHDLGTKNFKSIKGQLTKFVLQLYVIKCFVFTGRTVKYLLKVITLSLMSMLASISCEIIIGSIQKPLPDHIGDWQTMTCNEKVPVFCFHIIPIIIHTRKIVKIRVKIFVYVVRCKVVAVYRRCVFDLLKVFYSFTCGKGASFLR